MDSSKPLIEAITNCIANSPQKRITFAEYMDMALYHPEYGYYSTKAVNIGKQGDFFTSVHLGADFGELLAEQFLQIWQILGKPTPFSVVEMGAGQGYLAVDILNYIKQKYSDFFAALKYIIVDKSSSLKGQQQKHLVDFSVHWCDLEEIPQNSITGCFFSNELVDALPVNQFILQSGKLQEVYVTTSNLTSQPTNPVGGNNDFVEISAEPSTPQLAEYFDLIEIDLNKYPENYRSEINLAAFNWLSGVTDRLQRGYVLTIDYGYPAARYYNPMRNQGTLQCYYQHHRHSNPYINIGQQDITTHVDFTALERWGETCGLDKVGFIQQALFLMALGLGDRIAAISYQKLSLPELLKRRDALQQLIDPMGLGNFGVLVQSKRLSDTEKTQTLKGFTVPQGMPM
jgi:SAM-dependent MidA family methyltransferase